MRRPIPISHLPAPVTAPALPFMLVLMMAALVVTAFVPRNVIAQGDSWTSHPQANLRSGNGAPTSRVGAAYCWTGTHLWIFGGLHVNPSGTLQNSGGMYNPATDTWESKPNLNAGIGAPSPRGACSATWNGSKVVLIGGGIGNNLTTATGGIYDPATDTWETRTNLNLAIGAPAPRQEHFAAWTGSEVVIWGGADFAPPPVPFQVPVWTGGAYDPVTDTWRTTPSLSTPIAAPEFNLGGVFTGDAIVFRGGFGGTTPVHPNTTGYECSAGGVLDLEHLIWRTTPGLRSGLHAFDVRSQYCGWTGEWRVEFGGQSESISGSQNALRLRGDGSLYELTSDEFINRPTLNSGSGAPEARAEYMGGIWTGSHFLVYGGVIAGTQWNEWPKNGGLYDAVRDEWLTGVEIQSSANAPDGGRGVGVRVWTGSEFVVWGGNSGEQPPGGGTPVATYYNTGGIYVPPRVAPTIRSGEVDHALQANTFFRHRVTVYGCPRASVGVMGMPSWMTQKWLDTGCFLEGTPNAQEALQTSVITITADNGIGTFAMQTIRVGPPAAPYLDQIPNLQAEVDKRFEFRIPTGGPPYPTLTSPNMPAWMSIVSGRIEGYPTAADLNQVSTIVMTADNGVGLPSSRTFTVTVVTSIAGSMVAPGILMPSQANAVAGEPFGVSALLSGTPNPLLSSQNLPSWLSISGDLVFGTPPLALSNTTANITLTASNNVPPAATHSLQIAIAHNPRDVNRDSAIDVVDVQRIVNLILNLASPTYTSEGDANNDTSVDVIDAQLVVNRILSP